MGNTEKVGTPKESFDSSSGAEKEFRTIISGGALGCGPNRMQDSTTYSEHPFYLTDRMWCSCSSVPLYEIFWMWFPVCISIVHKLYHNGVRPFHVVECVK